jgi:hypothetical protein
LSVNVSPFKEFPIEQTGRLAHTPVLGVGDFPEGLAGVEASPQFLRGQQSLNTETPKPSVPSVLKAIRHGEHRESVPSRPESSRIEVRRIANLFLKIKPGARIQKGVNE